METIKEHPAESRSEGRRARVSTKQLQGTVKKVAKPCAKIGDKLSAIEERTKEAEVELGKLKGQVKRNDDQLEDII